MPTGIEISGVDFATVFVNDYAAATEFYGDTLGLEHLVDYGKSPAASSRPPSSSTTATPRGTEP